MVSFTLRARTKEEEKESEKVINDLKKVFGKERVEVRGYELWFSITITEVGAWVCIKDITYENKNRFHLYSEEDKTLQFDIDLDQCDTIYLL